MDSDGLRQQIAKSIERIEELLSYLPDQATRDLRARIATLRGVLLEQRPPAIALVGRRGAGKSSLVNALFGANVAPVGHVKARTMEGRWYEHRSARGALSILDTRGLQEGTSESESDPNAAAVGGILRELRRQPPDVILFLVRAGDVDSAIDADLDFRFSSLLPAGTRAATRAARGIRKPGSARLFGWQIRRAAPGLPDSMSPLRN